MTLSADTTYPLFPAFAFLGFIIVLIPLPWHLQAWNTGTCAFMVWTGLLCLNGFVNSLVWRGNVENIAPIWCDISTKYMLGAGVGIPASILCISRRLYNIMTIQSSSMSRIDKRRSAIGDLLIAVGFPVLIMVLHVVVQAHRFDILEDVGCYPVVYNTLPAYFLYWMWPAVLGAISLVYSSLTLRSFWRRRLQFQQLMLNSSMSASRYLRLMVLASIDVMCTTPFSVYIMYISNKGVTLSPWISWADTHYNFGRVVQVPSVLWRSNRPFFISVELTRSLPVFCAFVFFGLFGFASEAQKQYASTFWYIANRFGVKKPTIPNGHKPSNGWKKSPDSDVSPPYTPKSSTSKKQLDLPSLSYATASDDTGLSTYPHDVEMSAGLSSVSSVPPEYYPSRHDDNSPNEGRTSPHLSLRSSAFSFGSQSSIHTMQPVDSGPHIYISDAYPESEAGHLRAPSPDPFADVVAGTLGRPVIRLHQLSTEPLDAVRVTVHTHSESTDAL